MSQDQQTAIQELKSAAGWIKGYTPPNRHVLDDKGYSTISTSLVYAVYRHISQTITATASHPMVPLPPTPSQTPPIPPTMNTNPIQYGTAFGRQVSRTPHQYTDNQIGLISAASINGQIYNGTIFDANRNRLT